MVEITQADKKLAEAIIAVEHNNNHAEYEYNVASVIAQHRTRSVGEEAREHVMPGDPPGICQTALQWYLKFNFGYPHSVRESNIAVEAFKDGIRHASPKTNDSVDAVREALAKIMPIRVEDGPDYAEVYFSDGKSHSTQAMTMNPKDWIALQAAYDAALQTQPAARDVVDVANLFGQSSIVEVADHGCWSVGFHFGKGDEARDAMRKASDALRKALSQPAGEGL